MDMMKERDSHPYFDLMSARYILVNNIERVTNTYNMSIFAKGGSGAVPRFHANSSITQRFTYVFT